MSLFDLPTTDTWQPLPLPGGELSLWPRWLSAADADALLAELQAGIPWETHRIRIYGREVDSPRLSCWIGDADATYVYSRTRFEPHPWTPALAALRDRVAAASGARFNSVLANLYRDGNDSMGWHSDNEPELGERPVIASLSLGAVRRFRLKPRHADGRREVRVIELGHGSLLRMAGDTQQHYVHDLPRTSAATGARLNLTFRLVMSGRR
ncbi:alpha-ketoglutarate-dependent dioxygenase AlkB family protein [Dyella soli]|uniref:Alpha-ketoglutarate-dependent dioxygenase AlkB n=1 Tax=Dyella soli TaxID=522319 RepID=A0A4R0YWU9_9GAMM|nr:alpha-ketoglutarate-dependent dioxygenase AlkB [Dyella soli]TCI11112.1 alpha-ketoglutarate-dependent dioxygenase AlkB [Dyella soli]